MSEARAHLLRSVDVDPSFGLGHAQYALLTALARNIGVLPDDKVLVDGAVSAADHAIGLDHGSSEVLGHAGCALCDLGQNAEDSLTEAQASGRRDPRLHLARVLQAAALERLERRPEAAAALSSAHRLRPQLSLSEVAITHGRRAGEGLAPLWGETG
ncbi:hypothetical protein [Quisquiliibacterium transsilvanicum]|uniref:Tetratricopeptide repeat protein n=1 Tax=Quisquiliibacterium transsilvanicum TaxID=1549638 RepID=A0A7W8HFD3_9BURK|nr:hypothetical protein [Quisquiliibacterium transsilvanicum]MBB5270456.1 hypothetical protein [Quisquiliibacterium transsilvanicum]